MKLSEIFNFSNGKGIKLPSNGAFPIYGSTGIVGTTNNYLIDGTNTLIARVGANCGFTQYVNDKYWVTDNTLVATAKDGYLPKYGYYLLSTLNLSQYKIGAAQPLLTIGILNAIETKVHNISDQRHIVNTIGTVDDLIENIDKQNEKIFKLGIALINKANTNNERTKMSILCKLIKGYEVGSKNYIENNIQPNYILYIRVGDLLSIGKTYVEKSDNLACCSFNDILVAFDGSPGRNTIGIEGAFSSGIYKVNCNDENKGLLYFELNSELNKKIIRDHSQGTTILHASKAIPFLEVAKVDEKLKETLNTLFNQLVANKKKLRLLKKQKANLLSKYF